MKTRPAELFHVGVYIADELEARGWTTADAAKRMGGDPAVDELALDLWIACGDTVHLIMSDECARGLSLAFGTSPEIWMSLHKSFMEWKYLKSTGPMQDKKEQP